MVTIQHKNCTWPSIVQNIDLCKMAETVQKWLSLTFSYLLQGMIYIPDSKLTFSQEIKRIITLSSYKVMSEMIVGGRNIAVAEIKEMRQKIGKLAVQVFLCFKLFDVCYNYIIYVFKLLLYYRSVYRIKYKTIIFVREKKEKCEYQSNEGKSEFYFTYSILQ